MLSLHQDTAVLSAEAGAGTCLCPSSVTAEYVLAADLLPIH